MKKRRSVSVFGLSFLDVMFCGFGSIILLVMIVNADTVTRRDEVREDLRGEVSRLETAAIDGRRHLAELDASLRTASAERASARTSLERLRAALERLRTERAGLDAGSAAHDAELATVAEELKKLDETNRRLAAEAEARRREAEARGRQVRRFIGDGDRQYLTGLRMGGRRILVLVDTSASMLDDTIVNVIRRRNLSDESKRSAPKWRRAVATVEWLVSQLPPESLFQVHGFDVGTRSLAPGGASGWLAASDGAAVDATIANLDRVLPAGGTSLYHAFELIERLEPRPDNVFLLTDGLPTQGASAPVGSTVSGRERLRHFEAAAKRLPAGIPVNTILFPMEGDPFAPSAFWKLGAATAGSFITPSRDWP